MPDIIRILADSFSNAIVAVAGDAYAQTDPLIRPAANPKFGDYQSNVAMSLAKPLKQKPRDLAEQIIDRLDLSEVCERIEIAGPGFINLWLADVFLSRQLQAVRGDDRLGIPKSNPARTVVVDYGGPNIAKELHVGHLRSPVIGDAVVRVLQRQGHRVIRQNHVGDWGTQFGMLIEHLVETGWQSSPDQSIGTLNQLYAGSQTKFDGDQGFADRARKRVVSLQSGDAQTTKLWEELVAVSNRHFEQIYQRLGVLLTTADVRGESFYDPMLGETIDDLEQGGLLKTSQGAAVVFLDGFKDRDGDPLPMIVRKGDGGYLYATTDLAAARFRIRRLNADRIIYLTDARQIQHFSMVFQVLRQAGWAPDSVRLDHVPFGAILSADRKPFKTRTGEPLKLNDLIEEALERARRIIDEKNPGLPAEKRQDIAHIIGIGALKYADLCTDRIKDYVFDWDRMLAFDGNTAPYLQNAYVRIRSIFRRGEIDLSSLDGAMPAIKEAPERALATRLLQFPMVVNAVADSLEPHRLCTYLYELASLFHQFYERCPVLNAGEQETRAGRLVMCDMVSRTLKEGLDLLGIGVIEQM